jgi:hypothetical protein
VNAVGRSPHRPGCLPARSPWRSPVSARRPRSTRGDEWPSP